jgi:hypothetical protein
METLRSDLLSTPSLVQSSGIDLPEECWACPASHGYRFAERYHSRYRNCPFHHGITGFVFCVDFAQNPIVLRIKR